MHLPNKTKVFLVPDLSCSFIFWSDMRGQGRGFFFLFFSRWSIFSHALVSAYKTMKKLAAAWKSRWKIVKLYRKEVVAVINECQQMGISQKKEKGVSVCTQPD